MKLTWACLLILVWIGQGVCFGARVSKPSTGDSILTRVISVKAKSTGRETVFTIAGNGTMPEYSLESFTDSPRIVVDLLCASRSFQSRSITLKTPRIDTVRIGYHADRIRLVFDLKGSVVPAFSVKREKRSLILRVSLEEVSAVSVTPEKAVTESEPKVQAGKEDRLDARVAEPSLPPQPFPNRENGPETPPAASLAEKLLEMKDPDDREDSALFRKGTEAFRAERWEDAAKSFRALLQKHPESRYAERTSFLVAKSFDRSYGSSVSDHFIEIRENYEAFLARFPSSPYALEALVALGRLCFEMGSLEEAMAYYGFAFSRDKESPFAAEALAGKMKILSMKKQKDEALAAAEQVLQHFPRSPEALDAGLVKGRILYELNRFQESMSLLRGLENRISNVAYEHPDFSLTLGNAAYHLRDFRTAKENLLRFYNMEPGSKETPLVLSRIGDAYREEKRMEEAQKIYRWTVQHYPDSEGALISQIRLAELQEQEAVAGPGGKSDPKENTGKKISSLKEAYESIIKNPSYKHSANPLAAVALMRMAVIYQKEGEYEKSLSAAKELLTRFPPGRPLQREVEQILVKSLQEILSESLRSENYPRALGLYYAEKDLFHRIRSGALFLTVARAFLRLKLEEDAADLFKRAGDLLSQEERPADLLCFLAREYDRQGKAEQALETLKTAMGKTGNKETLFRAYQLRGKILVRQQHWDKAREAFTIAFPYAPDSCAQLDVLTERASAAAAGGAKEGALKCLRQAKALIASCKGPSLPTYEKLGKLFFLLGRPEEGIALLHEAEGKEKNEERLQWKLALAYEGLGQKEKSQALCQEITERGDPFWSRLASDKMEEMGFDRDLEAFTKP